MGLRERVQQAVEGPVGESDRLLSELQSADVQTKLSILINGWGRGVSAALEELAIAIDDLQERTSTATPDPATRSPADEHQSPESAAEPTSKQADLTDLDEERLIEKARKSSEETAEFRKEAAQVRRDLQQ